MGEEFKRKQAIDFMVSLAQVSGFSVLPGSPEPSPAMLHAVSQAVK